MSMRNGVISAMDATLSALAVRFCPQGLADFIHAGDLGAAAAPAVAVADPAGLVRRGPRRPARRERPYGAARRGTAAPTWGPGGTGDWARPPGTGPWPGPGLR